MKEVVRAILRSSNIEIMEYALDIVRSSQNHIGQIALTPIHAMRIQRTTTTSREVPGMISFEMALIFRALNETGGTTDER